MRISEGNHSAKVLLRDILVLKLHICLGDDVMEKCLLSVDWDYFIDTQKENWGSYIENNKNIVNLWYKRYIQWNERGKNIEKSFKLSSDVNSFWDRIKKNFQFNKGVQVYVSDSHALSYDIAKNNGCSMVYLFDAHADLGYGGLASLNFEVNCANWLGKLLKNNIVKEANIIYSPFTTESPEDFKQINNAYAVQFTSLNALKKKYEVPVVHICRSGAWTPPWFDEKFFQFINNLEIPYKVSDCPPRKWDTKNISFGDQIYYLMA